MSLELRFVLALCTSLALGCEGSGSDVPSDAVPLQGTAGSAAFPALELGAAADMSLLSPDELAVVEEADERAEALRTRPLEIHAPAGTDVRIELVRHGFPMGVAIDLRKLASEEDLRWYSELASRYFNFAVLESEAKWKVTGPEPSVRDYTHVDAVLAWGAQWDLAIKGHVLVWGNGPPLSSSGVPHWLLDRFPSATLSPAEETELRDLLEHHIRDSVSTFAGRIPIWDVTNETLQPLAQWFIDRLGPDITIDAFEWAREAGPETTLVMNEWITEVFTGLNGPTAGEIRDRLRALREMGVPIDAVGIQGQFTPALAHLGPGADVSMRTPLDIYARALDTIAEAGVPIHITEINVFTPEDQEVRAAHLTGAMRLWWGHPGVAQFGFWSLWNGVSGKRDYDVSLYDDDKNITPMGNAVMHLLNDVWRTRASATVQGDGLLSLRAAAGDYLVEWNIAGDTYWAPLEVTMSDEVLAIELVGAGND